MDEPLIDLLNRRIDDHVRCLHQRLDAVERRLHELHEALRMLHRANETRLDAHEEYHRANEHRWGLLRLGQLHPFRLALFSALLMALAATALPASLERVVHLLWQLVAH